VRILYLHQYFTTPAHGGGTRSYEMARRLVAAGHEVTLLTSSAFLGDDWAPARGWHVHDVEGVRVEVYRLPYSNRDAFATRIRRFLSFMRACTRRARGCAADVILATSTPLTIAVPGLLARGRLGAPLVFEVRDLWPELPIAVGALRNPLLIAGARWLERRAYHGSARVVALSPGMADGVVATGYPRDRVAVIPNACDLDLFDADAAAAADFRARFPWLGDRPLVVYAGTLGRINGVAWLAEVAHAVRRRDPEVRFLVLGDGMERERVEARARELGVWEDNFYLAPPLPKREMPAVLRAADLATSLFVPLEAMWHNSANKFFDALAAGCPPAINYGGWQADLLRDTGAGLALDPHDVEAAAAALADALADRDALRDMGEAARRLARERFDRDVLAAELEALLHAASDERGVAS
jgi:glycosyltransferase involved in cell wall biosynthesis